MVIKKSSVIFLIYISIFIIITWFFYNYHSKFYLADGLNYIVADSKYYYIISQRNNSFISLYNLMLRSSKNIFGPIFYFEFILRSSRKLFFIVTIGLFVYAIKELYKKIYMQKKKNKILFFLLLNPAIFGTLSGPNKEITGFICILFLLNYSFDKKFKYIMPSLLFALMTRFELILVIIMFLFISRFKLKNRIKLLVLIIILISIFYLFYKTSYSSFMEGNENRLERATSIGLIEKLDSWNHKGMYIFTFIPKLCINLFGELAVKNIVSLKGYALDLYLSQMIYIYLIFIIIKNKKANLQSNFMYIFLIYSIIFTIPVFIQHRYFLPIYPVLVLLAYYERNQIENIKTRF